MSKFKKITFLWLLFISIFLIFNFLVFFNYTSKVYPDTADTTIGDLARMSYMVDIIQERENIVEQTRNWEKKRERKIIEEKRSPETNNNTKQQYIERQ